MDSRAVGRDSDLVDLGGWWEETVAGRGRTVLVSGEAGIGKSRLVAELADRIEASGFVVLWGRTTEQDGAPPYWPWLQVLDGVGARPLLEGSTGTDPESDRFARFEGVAAALAAAATEPLLVVVEDVHRADVASLRLLSSIAERLAGSRVMLVVTHRSSPIDRSDGFDPVLGELLRLSGTRRIELEGLSEAAIAVLLDRDVADPVVGHVSDTTGGNPLYAVELSRHVSSGKDLSTVPRTVSEGVRRRLAERSPGCVEVVQIAAVIGRTFSIGLVAAAVDRDAVSSLSDLQEAVEAGMVEPGPQPDEMRFVHALVRDAIESSLGSAQLALLHRQVAQAIEAHLGTGDDQASHLARHWDAASVLGDRLTAASWCERAAEVAERRLAWEEAVRLFERALALDGNPDDPLTPYRRMLGSARNRLHCDELGGTVDAALAAAGAARGIGRADLAAEALMLLEGRSMTSHDLLDATRSVLDDLAPDDHARRARLHGQLTHLAFGLESFDAMVDHCERAGVEADAADDPFADLAAIRARHAVRYGPEHAAERVELADRLGRVARAVGRPSIALWEPLWRIDALVELGRLRDAVATIPALRRAVAAAGSPMARWHLERVEAVLAQASGRYGEALGHAEAARSLLARHEDPYTAEGVHLGFRVAVEMHAGWTRDLDDRHHALDLDSAPAFLSGQPWIGAAMVAAGTGDPERAAEDYAHLPSMADWDPMPHVWLAVHVGRVHVAARLGLRDDLVALIEALEPHRGRHVGQGGGIVCYLGPVDLWVGIAAAGLDRWEYADAALSAASSDAAEAGAPGFVVHADVERASVLLRRGGDSDLDAARSLAQRARPAAVRLGMGNFVDRIDAVLGGRAGPLSPRESEVAGLVAQGRTNRAIAEALFLSERTVQNHVQHILTKLRLRNRTEVAGWYRDTIDPTGGEPARNV